MPESGSRELWRRITGGERWRTVPNAITAARLLLLPVLVVLLARQEFVAATLLAAVVFLSDAVDGFIARRFDQASALGRWLDPATDRMAILALLIGLAWSGIVPGDLIALAAVPDGTLAVVAILFFRGTPAIPVSRFGKARTVAQFSAFFLLLAGSAAIELGAGWAHVAVQIGVVLFAASIVASFVAGTMYSIAASRLLAGKSDERLVTPSMVRSETP